MEFSDSCDEDTTNNNNPSIRDSTDNSCSITKNKKWIKSDDELSDISQINQSEDDNNENSQSNNEEKEQIDKINIIDSDQDEEENNEQLTRAETKQPKKTYTFIWNEKGKNIKLTGSFSNWKEQIEMQKDPNDNFFKVSIPLSEGKYQYKFIVDGVWKCAKNQSQVTDDKGNTNNVLEISSENVNNKQKNKKSKNNKKSPKKINKNTKNEKNNEKKVKSKNKLKRKKSGGYGNVFPGKDEDSNLGASLPDDNFGRVFNLDNFTKQNKVLNSVYLKYQKQENYCASRSYGELFNLGHVNSNHLFSAKKSKKGVNRYGLCYKFREKTSTFIYYNNKGK